MVRKGIALATAVVVAFAFTGSAIAAKGKPVKEHGPSAKPVKEH